MMSLGLRFVWFLRYEFSVRASAKGAFLLVAPYCNIRSTLICQRSLTRCAGVQFKPQYNTYTMYTDMDAEDGAAARSPTEQSTSRPNTSTPQENPYHKDRIDAGKF